MYPYVIAGAVGGLLGWMLRKVFSEERKEMIDLSKEIEGFHDSSVRLTKEQMEMLRGARDTNEDRVIKGLEKAKRPLPTRRKPLPVQGSFAMKTIVQQSENDFDIDVALIFNDEELVGSKGGDINALGARQMVRDALLDDRFKRQPALLPNCVRLYYEEGYHVDMPVYRKRIDSSENEILELASSDGWKESDPEAVTKWFNKAVIEKSLDSNNGRQLRRVVRLLKMWTRSRSSWNMPSGFIISALVVEQYQPVDGRDDESLVRTMASIFKRLSNRLDVEHPILNGVLISENKENKIKEFKDRIEASFSGELQILFEEGCSKEDGLKAYKKFFKHEYFSDANKTGKSLLTAAFAPSGNLSFPDKPVKPRKPGGFA